MGVRPASAAAVSRIARRRLSIAAPSAAVRARASLFAAGESRRRSASARSGSVALGSPGIATWAG